MGEILVFNPNRQRFEDHIQALFRRLEEYDVVNKLEKCVFGVPQLDFFSHRMDGCSNRRLPERVKGIRNFRNPPLLGSSGSIMGLWISTAGLYHTALPPSCLLMLCWLDFRIGLQCPLERWSPAKHLTVSKTDLRRSYLHTTYIRILTTMRRRRSWLMDRKRL